MSLAFVTPAYQRLELSRICFQQRKHAIDILKDSGIEATAIVIADDENLELARECGFIAVERDNEWLGRRFNDGYYEAAMRGFTHVFPIGSDSWCDPQFIIDAVSRLRDEPESVQEAAVIASRHYTRFDKTGTKRMQLWIPVGQGVSYVMPVSILAPSGYRPCQEDIRRGCDGSTWDTIRKTANPPVFWSEAHSLETTSFESYPQITKFSRLGTRWKTGLVEKDVFQALYSLYDSSLVLAIEKFYEDRRTLEEDDQSVDDRVREITNKVLASNKVPSSSRQHVRRCVQQAVRMALSER